MAGYSNAIYHTEQQKSLKSYSKNAIGVKKSFQKKRGHFAHIGNEIKICSQNKSVAKINAIITFLTSVKIHFVCFTVTGSFLITIHLLAVRISLAESNKLPKEMNGNQK